MSQKIPEGWEKDLWTTSNNMRACVYKQNSQSYTSTRYGAAYITESAGGFLCKQDTRNDGVDKDEVLFNGQRFPTLEAAVVALKVGGYV